MGTPNSIHFFKYLLWTEIDDKDVLKALQVATECTFV